MQQIARPIIIKCLEILLRPIVLFCVRHSLHIQDIVECCKIAFVTSVVDYLEKLGEKVTSSRIGAMTGIHRRDITRILDGRVKLSSPQSLVPKIIGQWQTSRQFVGKNNKPKVLSLNDKENGFDRLVQSVSQDIGPATILAELMRIGAATRKGDNLSLNVQAYTPQEDMPAGFRILASDCSDLIVLVEENMKNTNKIPNMHLRTEYDKVKPEHGEEIRSWLVREGHAFHAKARDFLSQYDHDVNPDPKYKIPSKWLRVVLGSFGNVTLDKSETKE